MADLDQIKQLREETGISFGEIKKALDESEGDPTKAKELLRERGAALALKRSDKGAHQGVLEGYIHNNGTVGVLVDLRCETDFVAKSHDFKALAHEIALQIAFRDPEIEPLEEQKWIKDTSKSIQDIMREAVAKLGERIVLERYTRYEL